MSHFYAPCHDFVTLQSRTCSKNYVRHTNAPLNLDLVLSYQASEELYNFGSTGAGRVTRDEPVSAIVFDIPGSKKFAWFFDCDEVRDAELRALTNHLVNKAS